MSDSSFGNGALKSRSINVGANMLGEWIEEQAKLRQQFARYGAVLSASVLVAVVACPILGRKAGVEGAELKGLKAGIAGLDEQLKIADKAKKEAQPAKIVHEMNERTRVSFDRFVGQLDHILRAGNPQMALAMLKLEMTSGEAHVTLQADAEDDAAAEAFAKNASEEGATVDSITSSRPSALLSTQGLSFLYEKKIRVDK